MFSSSRSNGLWLFVCLLSLLAYNLYWFVRSGVRQGYTLVAEGFPNNYSDRTYWVAHITVDIGTALCLIGCSLALWSVYSIWGAQKKSLFQVKGRVSVAIVLLGLYFASFFASGFWLLTLRPIPQTVFAFSYFLQPFLTAPIFFALAFKIRRQKDGYLFSSLLRWFAAAFVGLIAALWVSDVFDWLAIISIFGVSFLQFGNTILGFLNSAIVASLSLAFAVAMFIPVLKKLN